MSEQNQQSTPNEPNFDNATEITDSASLAEAPKQSKKSFLKEAVDYLEMFVLAVCAVILIFSFAFRICTVDGESMENTLLKEENLLVSDLFYTPKRGDIVVFHQTKTLNEPIVKRVLATEGDHISLSYENGIMEITITDSSGQTFKLEEPYVKYEGFPYTTSAMSVTVPDGMLFVMGDNRNNSMDSRHQNIGFVDERRVLGKVILRITPLSRFGFVE